MGFFFYGIEQTRADVELVELVEFADAGRAGHVDFGQVVADDVEADKQEPAFAQRWTDLLAYPAVALAERDADAGATGREIGAGFTGGGNTGERVRHRFAVDQ